MSLDTPPCPSLQVRKKDKKGKTQMNVVSAQYFAWFDFATMLTLHSVYPCLNDTLTP